MEIAALCIALLALFLVCSTRSQVAGLREQLAERSGPGSSSGNADVDEISERVQMNSRFLARLAAGESLAPHQVREGELWTDVSPAEALLLVEQGARVLDVRTLQETASGVIPGAICIPVDELPTRFDELPRDHALTLIYCAVGVRSAAACQYLTEQGFDSLINLDGGFGCWSGAKERPA